ncbi:cell wall-binding repeat-containing protein [Clostridium sporogenes]|uniref:cell wall-binding repeat-containing protein n=1 Tax=Clostridium sporogenes TaxID=1509 RepID=UPI0013D6DE91|nr:cell wall-binding repeat-containing protein [Clostridium sporogenes]NFG96371.1 cell wall-binding repeat-containing protein [Clostridium sporogenes]NFH33851.1 cell wall-binding repeat-containing protein [Clostridium sporogenes]NFL20959.1 cell wall-binding repeat-containing protein [Clostridium sporogenes]NFN73170.1 cell wall-binding repeat-containing protein [Clostridium sporogenes]NFV22702.1 cell wall-binding repeat-containing protein [Clostridium sporogenes]
MNKKGTRALASATVVGLVLATVTTGNVKAAPGDVNKVQGNDRYETAANVAKTNWKDGAENVIIASGNGYADSLSASVLAKKLNAPIILTTAGELNSNAKNALETLKPKNVYVIGGNASVAQSVRDGLKKQYTVTELGGQTRFETNIAVANHLVDKLGVKAENVMVVNGKDGFSDALSAAPVAAAKEQVLLIVGKDASTADLAADFVKKHNSKVTVIGTEGVVPAAVYNKLGASERVNGGADRFDTNLKIMEHFKLNADKMYVANATDGQKGYADALVASALAGKNGAPLVLVDTKDAQGTKNAIKYIKDNQTDKTEVSTVGGKGVMPDEIVNEIENSINPELAAAEKAVKAYEDAKIGTAQEITAAKALKADAVKAVNNVKDATKKSAFEARIAAKDKAITDAESNLKIRVESATAINAKEIKVVYNKEVNEKSAEDTSKYTIHVGKDNEKLDSKDFTADLQDDNKTVILQLNEKDSKGVVVKDNSLKNGQSYKVEVKDVVDTNYNKIDEYKGEFKLFNDENDPKVLKTEYEVGSTVKVTFDEPIKTITPSSIKIDGKVLKDQKVKVSDKAGEYELKISNLSDDNKKVGKHTVEIFGAEDFAGNKADMLTTEYKAIDDNAKPEVEKIEVKDNQEDAFKVKFNTTIKKLDETNFDIKKDGYKLPQSAIKVKEVDNEDYTYEVNIDQDELKKISKDNPLYDDDEKEITLNIKIENFQAENNNIGDYKTTLKFHKDEEAPKIQADTVNTVDGNKLVVVFNEDLKEGEAKKDKITVNLDGVLKEVNTAEVDSKDNKRLNITLKEKVNGNYEEIQKLDKGTYAITLKKGTVEDKAGNENEVTNTKIVYDGEKDSVISGSDMSVVSNTVQDKENNVIIVNYKTKMEDSAINKANYKLNGVSLDKIDGTTIGFENSSKESVKITLGTGQIVESNAKQNFAISTKVTAENGSHVAKDKDNDDKDYTKELTNLIDDVDPTIKSIELVKENSDESSNNTRTIKVTFDEDVKIDDNKNAANDFEVKVGDSKIPVKSVTLGTNAIRDYAVIQLGQDVNVKADNITLKVTDEKKDNPDDINIIDDSAFKNAVGATDTLKVTKVITDKDIVNEGKAAVEAEKAETALATINKDVIKATETNYTDAGITGVDSKNLTAVNTAVAAAKTTKGSDLTKAEIQTVVDKVAKDAANEVEKTANEKAVAEAKEAAIKAEYKMEVASATDELAVKKAIEDKIAGLDKLKDVKATVTKISYTAAVAGASDGTYKFTVELSKGTGDTIATTTTEELTMTITK